MPIAFFHQPPVSTNFESLHCIWLDQHVNETEDNRVTYKKLRTVINHFQLFDNCHECEQSIRKISKEKIVLIVSGTLGQMIIPRIHDLPQFLVSYIYCKDLKANQHWSSSYPKVIHRTISREFLSFIQR